MPLEISGELLSCALCGRETPVNIRTAYQVTGDGEVTRYTRWLLLEDDWSVCLESKQLACPWCIAALGNEGEVHK